MSLSQNKVRRRKVAKNESGKTAPSEEKDLTLSEHMGVLVFGVVLFFGGGALIVWGNGGGASTVWGKVATVVGGISALLGLIMGLATIQGILKSLWRGVSRKR